MSAKKRRPGRTVGIVAAAAALVLVAIGSIVIYQGMESGRLLDSVSAPASGQGSATDDIITPVSYDELYESLENRAFGDSDADGVPLLGAAPEGSTSSSAESAGDLSTSAPLASTDDSTATSSTGPIDYSQTNTQVEGIDEADIVKTDGENIYSLYFDEVIITSADGAKTEVLANIPIAAGTAQDMYVFEDRLMVMSSGGWGVSGDDSTYRDYSQSCFVTIYDVSDPSSPRLLDSFGQDGSLNTSRLANGVLYTVSTYTIYSGYTEPGDPGTFVPSVYNGSESGQDSGSATVPQGIADLGIAPEPMDIGAIRIMPEYTSAVYTVLTAIDVDKVRRSGELSVLGYTDTVYMSEENLFLAATSYGYVDVQPLGGEDFAEDTDSPAQLRRIPIFPWEMFHFIIDPEAWFSDAGSQAATSVSTSGSTFQPSTRLVRIALGDGRPDTAATTAVTGTLLNQFSLDEYGGFLRVAITERKDAADVPGSGGETSSAPTLTVTTNSLLVLDDSLEVVGSIEDLAPGERIYSARFSGEVGYMVTFRQVDPLFSLDLSDPQSPKVMDALKIPGFSRYLHPYADGLLLGLGENSSSSGTLTDQLKLSMFDVSDPFDISEGAKLLIDATYTDALYNHKAVLIDESKNIIGFSVTTTVAHLSSEDYLSYETKAYYMIYGYDEATGFQERAAIELPEAYEQARAVYIEKYLYIVNGGSLGVFALDTLEEIAWITLY